jgi:hypothetical protein
LVGSEIERFGRYVDNIERFKEKRRIIVALQHSLEIEAKGLLMAFGNP